MAAPLSHEDRFRLYASIDKTSEIKPRLALEWVQVLLNLAEFIAHPKATIQGPEIDMFWIRLYGVLTEITEFYRHGLTLVENAEFAAISGLKESDIKPAYSKCMEVKQLLKEDELIYAEYRRHSVAHVWQTGYDLQATSKGTLKDSRKLALLGKVMKKEEIEERNRSVVRRYDCNENAIATEFARRLIPALRGLLGEMMRLQYS